VADADKADNVLRQIGDCLVLDRKRNVRNEGNDREDKFLLLGDADGNVGSVEKIRTPTSRNIPTFDWASQLHQ
jgi:hypothetical protein